MSKKKNDEIIQLENEKNECLKSLEELQSKINLLENELKEQENKYNKAIQDWQHSFQVIKRDSFRQRALATEQLIRDLLPFIDSLEEATKSSQEDYPKIVEGIFMMQRNLQIILEKHGLIRYGEIGDVFDPGKHEILSIEDQPDFKPNTIIKIFRKGYLLGNVILKPALVSVAGSINKTKEDLING